MPILRVKSGRHVLIGTALITLVSVIVPIVAMMIPMMQMQRLPASAFWGVLAVSGAIPLFIAPPISYFTLSILRLLTVTIDRIDDYVKFDALTGVLSRAYLLGKVREALTGGGAFLMVDADHFKAINDTHGHDIGDEALKRIAETLRTTLSSDALVGRLGGEEFGVFLPGADDAQAAAAAASLCAAMRVSGAVIAGLELKVTISVGGATHSSSWPWENTMKLADAALYHAKRSGRDRFYIAAATDTMPALLLRASEARSA